MFSLQPKQIPYIAEKLLQINVITLFSLFGYLMGYTAQSLDLYVLNCELLFVFSTIFLFVYSSRMQGFYGIPMSVSSFDRQQSIRYLKLSSSNPQAFPTLHEI